MRIAQVSPLYEAVPPRLYGGTERVVSFLTEELVAMGHEVTLFASGDSRTSARLEPMCEEALRLDPNIRDRMAPHMKMMEVIRDRVDEFDVIHFHNDYLPFSLFSRQPTPFVTTIHGRLDLPEFVDVYGAFPKVALVSISDSQRAPVPNLNWVRTVHHGLPQNILTPRNVRQDYLAVLGRVSPEKGVDKAIHIAGKAGLRIKIAAKVDAADEEYFQAVIKPLLKQPHVEFIGEINEMQKPDFLSGAHALLFPIDWPEPFGLVMIESMACGTPVITFERGSVPEVIEDGVTGFITRDEADAVRAVRRLDEISRVGVRARFEQRFSARRMAENYLSVYEEMVERPRTAQLRVIAG
jgi:glycosyltransferase involved in cell wall biosynthesis